MQDIYCILTTEFVGLCNAPKMLLSIL